MLAPSTAATDANEAFPINEMLITVHSGEYLNRINMTVTTSGTTQAGNQKLMHHPPDSLNMILDPSLPRNRTP